MDTRQKIAEAVRLAATGLSRYAAAGKIPQGQAPQIDGVEVHFSPKEAGVAILRLATHDDIEVRVKIDFGAFSRDYYERMVHDVGEDIERKRAERSPIVLPDKRLLVAALEAVH